MSKKLKELQEAANHQHKLIENYLNAFSPSDDGYDHSVYSRYVNAYCEALEELRAEEKRLGLPLTFDPHYGDC